jgi:hypothetical protein
LTCSAITTGINSGRPKAIINASAAKKARRAATAASRLRVPVRVIVYAAAPMATDRQAIDPTAISGRSKSAATLTANAAVPAISATIAHILRDVETDLRCDLQAAP